MLTDRYGLSVGTQSAAARDAYAEGVDLMVAACPGGAAALDRALAQDPSFVLAHLGKARSMHLAGNLPAMRESFEQAQALSGSMSERERSQTEIFRRLFAGQAADALVAVRSHMTAWPRDALVLSLAANQSGLIGISGLAGREDDLADFLGRLAPEYGNDWFFDGHYAMALSEVGRRDEARPRVERSLAQRSLNGYGAHAFAHLCYETGDLNAGIAFLREWLKGYDRAGAMFGHINWHLALFELQAGRVDEGWRLYNDAFSADDHRGAAHQKVVDSVAFLWRSELAGHPRDGSRWKKIHEYAVAKFTKPGMFLADWHVALAHVAAGDEDGLTTWIAAIEERVRAGAMHRRRSCRRSLGRSLRSSAVTTRLPSNSSGRYCRNASAWGGVERRSISSSRRYCVLVCERGAWTMLGVCFEIGVLDLRVCRSLAQPNCTDRIILRISAASLLFRADAPALLGTVDRATSTRTARYERTPVQRSISSPFDRACRRGLR